MNRTYTVIFALLASLFAGLAVAQQDGEAVMPQVMESEQFGPYLTDAEGRTLYLFVNEELEGQGPARMTEGVRAAAVSCTGGCLDAWPPLTSEGALQAGDQIDPELLYTAEVDGRTQVVYNGWPLYYFARDEQPGQLAGQGIVASSGATWYIVSPQGTVVHGEGEQPTTAEGEGADGDVAGGGEAEQDGADDGGQDDAAAGGGEADQDGAAGGGQDDAAPADSQDGAAGGGAEGAQDDGAAGGGAGGAQDDAGGAEKEGGDSAGGGGGAQY